MAIDVEVRAGDPDLLLRTARGDAHALEAKWLGDRGTR